MTGDKHPVKSDGDLVALHFLLVAYHS
jgi:hypothetical protein